MCTLSFIPLKSGAVVTTNRDESPLRNAHSLTPYTSVLNEAYLIAKEPLYGGTNVAVGKRRITVLLNGAFERYEMKEATGLSRGLAVLKSLNSRDLFSFSNHFKFELIQPFTLVHFDTSIQEIRWDGKRLYREEFGLDKPRLWASAQLYLPEARKNREAWFRTFLKSENITPEAIASFHFNAGNGDPSNDMVMNRKGLVQTVSITQTFKVSAIRKIRHWDLVDNTEMDYEFGS